VTPDGATPPPTDLLVQAVEGMQRPLFGLDGEWRFAYVNPAGAAVLRRDVAGLTGRVVWDEFPEAVGSPFEDVLRQVAATGAPGTAGAFYAPLGTWFRADAFLTDAGLVVTYDDVTLRRRTEEERGGRRRAARRPRPPGARGTAARGRTRGAAPGGRPPRLTRGRRLSRAPPRRAPPRRSR
jgi:hypothetical protein